ncbi:carbohydrate ABC transporter permease [Saccharibacillus sp. CPCC 101409]|uniref:carbohydrate ABC transporter permease n=1 Tax=Saccharibacillus sp. CPCC 101409 TaxID=3058041 RepID=UPI002673BDE4|nr:carbohydrate ABC transporter permease [Saccharibacillus sp. CPCC 101409]MDO3411795.1 carbohydrate ABC transporter permease [Saccharibacillus sp. CPCC 101409]
MNRTAALDRSEQSRRNSRLPERLATGAMGLFLIVFALLCLFPFWLIVVNSFASTKSLALNGYALWPNEFTLGSYRFLLQGKQLFTSYGITIAVTAIGTLLGVLVTMLFAYVLAHPKNRYGGILSFMTYVPMVFGSGLVGFYLLVVQWLHLKDSLWALVLPYVMNPFFAFILVSFYRSLPYELNESAKIDGAGEWSIFFRIIRPISTPVIATISLFYALQYWNDWWLSLLFIDNSDKYPLQLLLRQLMSQMQLSSLNHGNVLTLPPAEGVKLATVCLTIGPIIFVYPMVQKYFVKGLTLGSVKG